MVEHGPGGRVRHARQARRVSRHDRLQVDHQQVDLSQRADVQETMPWVRKAAKKFFFLMDVSVLTAVKFEGGGVKDLNRRPLTKRIFLRLPKPASFYCAGFLHSSELRFEAKYNFFSSIW